MSALSFNTASPELSSVLRVHDVGTRSVRYGDLTALLDALVESVMLVTQADFAGIQLFEPETRRLRLEASSRYPAGFAEFIDSQPEEQLVCGAAVARREQIVIEDTEASEMLNEAERAAVLDAQGRAFQVTPLFSCEGNPVGVVSAYFRAPHRPTMEQLQMVDLLTGQAADFIEQSRSQDAARAVCARERDARLRSDAANRSTNEFVASLAHELRQPLAAAMAAIEVQRRSLSAERRQRAGEVIEQQLQYLTRLVEDLSDASGLSLGSVNLHRETLDLRAVVQEAVDMNWPAFDRRRHSVAVALGPEPVCVSADRRRMKQVFSNLLQNAATYTPLGGQVSVSLDQRDGHAVFRLRDNGAGIPADALRRIFELVERTSPRGDVPTIGIGLAVVRRLVELHGGTVSATSDGAGQGSEFVVALEAVPAPAC